MPIEVDDRTRAEFRRTREQRRQQFAEVETLLIRRAISPVAIVRECAPKFKCSQRQVWRYIKALRVIYRERSPLLTPDEMRDVILADHRLAVEAGDHRAAHKHMELLARIQGQIQSPTARVEVQHKGQVNHAHAHVALPLGAIRATVDGMPREERDALEAALTRMLAAPSDS